VFNILPSDELSPSINHQIICSLYNDCEVVYVRLGRLNQALERLYIAKNHGDEHLPDDHDRHGLSFLNIGRIFALQGDITKGMEYYKLATEFYNRIGLSDSLKMSHVHCNIGEWYKLLEQKTWLLNIMNEQLEL
jgi:tetratricopeptide (TPR) repeat protein